MGGSAARPTVPSGVGKPAASVGVACSVTSVGATGPVPFGVLTVAAPC